MRPPPRDLPSFAAPPVVETVLSVQFEPLLGLRTAQLGLLWGEYRSTFPRTEERPPLEPVIERFPETPARRASFRLQAFENPPVPRLSFTTSAGDEMIQVQSDRFIKNWQKAAHDSRYPRYERTIRPNFDRDFNLFVSFLSGIGLGAPRINQCEVTYVNHIIAGEGWETHADVEQIFAFWNPPTRTPPGNAEDVRTNARFTIHDDAGKPIGRLHLDVQPAMQIIDNRLMYVLHLTARGQLGAGLEFFDVGHEWIVKTFRAITTPKMHRIWKIEG